MNHKYSTMAIFLLFGVGTIILVSGLDGSGIPGYIPIYYSPDRLIVSSLFVNDTNFTFNGSQVCTVGNGLCQGGGVNNITYNITNNITNNFTTNETRFPVNLTTIENGNIVNVRICLYNDTCYNDSFIDSTGGGGGGISSDQAVNTTSNVTFDNIIGTNNITTDYLKITGYTTNPAIFSDNDANSGIMFDGPDIVSIHTGGVQAVLVNALQYTGFGMTPNQRITINGSGNFTENVTATNFRGNINWSFLQNIPTYIIDYMPYITSVQTNITNLNTSLTTSINNVQSNVNSVQANTTNVNTTLMNLINTERNNNATQNISIISLQNNLANAQTNITNLNNSLSNSITYLVNSNITINGKLNSAISNFTTDNTTQSNELISLRASNLTAGRIGSINCTAGNLLYNVTLNTSGIYGTCVADQSGSFTGKINSSQLNTTNTAINGYYLTATTNDQMTWVTPPGGSSRLINTTRRLYETTENRSFSNMTLDHLNITLDANSNYTVLCNLQTSSAAATTGEQIAMNFSASTTINVTYQTHVSATLYSPFTNNGAGTGFAFADTGSFGTNTPGVAIIFGSIRTGATATLLTYRLKSEVGNSLARVIEGSNCEYIKYT